MDIKRDPLTNTDKSVYGLVVPTDQNLVRGDLKIHMRTTRPHSRSKAP
ncbi:hypothetical protein DFR76_1124 [Nocardia pseudobrasiliensis]|uniref:Uncharacterized protein n=1 Tax=Nocardia pseudobrasiliensis TaxID=45979 RepID=A0A370HW03_9NOCA|nr:hypothetical protein DFR76_1124 [Nocardia pseudobrasiliensis]